MTRLLLINSFFLCALLSLSLNAQTPEPILFGTYLASSYHPEITYHRFNDSNLVKIGFNTIIQTVMHPVIHNKLFTTEPIKWHDNRIPLGSSSFSNIVALNSYWNKEDEQQVDWVKILTHGAYNKWEVEGRNVFQSNIIKMVRDQNHTSLFNLDGVVGIQSSSLSPHQSDIVMISGPGMYQDPNYKVEDRDDADYIPYYADFRMKIGMIPIINTVVCTLRVRVDYPVYFGNTVTGQTKILAQRTLTSDDLSTGFITERLTYQISGLGKTTELEPEFITQTDQEYVLISASKIYYEVIIPQGVNPSLFGHLFVDYIEVSETRIWGENGEPNQIEQQLGNYNDIWDSIDVGSVYSDKIKYFYTMDEPHSFDHYLPYQKVEAVQKTLNDSLKNKQMLTKIYPEWSGEKEGINIIDKWAEVAKPRKLMFWYYTIFNEQEGTYISQLQLRTRIQEAARYDKDFFYTAQTWGSKNKDYIGVVPSKDYHYYKYRTPTGNQVLGQSMLALAYGCKGLFYETYYSYLSRADGWGDYFVEGLVGEHYDYDYDKPRLNDFGLYDTIVSLGKRLKGPLGNLLAKMKFSGEESYIYDRWDGTRVPEVFNSTKLRIFGDGIPVYPSTRMINLGVTRLQPKNEYYLRGDYYFLHNQNTFDNVTPNTENIFTYNNLHVGLSVTGLLNWRFYDIEGGNDFRFTNNSTEIDFTEIIPIGKGDGRLYRLISLAASTGTFLTDEVIPSGEIISSEGAITVPTGVTLKIEGNYTLTDSLIIEDGGVLTLEPGSTLYCAGDIYINGTETNKVTINFLQPNESKQNSIYLGRESSAIIKYAQIKNGYSGITATNGFDALIIDNCNFTNISHSALLLNGNGYDNAKIKNNTYTNCDYAGFFSNLSSVVINSDSANTTSGYYFSKIEYALPKEGLVTIKLFDITGRLVKQLVNEQKPSGRHKTTIESGNLASGIYIYSLRVNDININKKLVILK